MLLCRLRKHCNHQLFESVLPLWHINVCRQARHLRLPAEAMHFRGLQIDKDFVSITPNRPSTGSAKREVHLIKLMKSHRARSAEVHLRSNLWLLTYLRLTSLGRKRPPSMEEPFFVGRAAQPLSIKKHTIRSLDLEPVDYIYRVVASGYGARI